MKEKKGRKSRKKTKEKIIRLANSIDIDDCHLHFGDNQKFCKKKKT